jgi:hypothetical protein
MWSLETYNWLVDEVGGQGRPLKARDKKAFGNCLFSDKQCFDRLHNVSLNHGMKTALPTCIIEPSRVPRKT